VCTFRRELLAFDIDSAEVGAIDAGPSYIGHIDPAAIAALAKSGAL
jgi:hypothetical protein